MRSPAQVALFPLVFGEGFRLQDGGVPFWNSKRCCDWCTMKSCWYLLQGGGASEEHAEPSLVALFTFVARDPVTGSAMRVNRLAPTTDLERARFADRQDVADARRAARRAGADPSASPAGIKHLRLHLLAIRER